MTVWYANSGWSILILDQLTIRYPPERKTQGTIAYRRSDNKWHYQTDDGRKGSSSTLSGAENGLMKLLRSTGINFVPFDAWVEERFLTGGFNGRRQLVRVSVTSIASTGMDNATPSEFNVCGTDSLGYKRRHRVRAENIFDNSSDNENLCLDITALDSHIEELKSERDHLSSQLEGLDKRWESIRESMVIAEKKGAKKSKPKYENIVLK